MCTRSARLATLLVTFAASAASAQPGHQTMPIDEVRRGQRGYGLSVFEGVEPQRFDVEVLGVMENTAPDQSYILARLTGQNLEETGVIAGMSGSPVYIDDRLVGAVAFAWPFAKGAVGGITPIDSMLALSASETPSGTAVSDRLPTMPAQLRRLALEPELLERQLGRLVPALPSEARDGIVWSLSGFGPRSRSLLERVLAGAAPAGSARGGIDADLVPGSAVAGVLVHGDFEVAATGTVTERRDDEILAFGHAFLGQGPIRVPMAAAEVITVLSSQFVSFKIANVGPLVGAFDIDRATGIHGRLGAVAETVPLTVELSGIASREYHMELADVPSLLPSLVAVSTLGALDQATRAGGDQGLDLKARWNLEGYEPLELAQSFDGSSAGMTSALYLLAITNFLVNNPLEETRLEGVTVSLEQHPKPRTTRIVSAWANRSIVEPGERVEVTLELAPFRGEPTERRSSFELPRDLPDGRYSLMLGDGVSMDTVRWTVEPVTPETFEQSLDMVRRFHSDRELVAFGLVPSWGLSFSGRVLPQLPGSIRRLWERAAPGEATPLGLAVVDERVEASEVPLSGVVRVDLEVRRTPAVPMRSGPGEGEGEGGEAAAEEEWARRGGSTREAQPATTGDPVRSEDGGERRERPDEDGHREEGEPR